MGIITDICFSIDTFNNIERNKNKSFLLEFKQYRNYKKLKKLIKKIENKTNLDVDTINDFYFNYMATTETVGTLNNCECIYNEDQKQFIFSIKNNDGAVAFSTYKIKDPIIEVIVHRYNKLDVKHFKYNIDFKPKPNISKEQNELGEKCEILLKDCIANYLLMRLDMFKKEDE